MNIPLRDMNGLVSHAHDAPPVQREGEREKEREGERKRGRERWRRGGSNGGGGNISRGRSNAERLRRAKPVFCSLSSNPRASETERNKW